MPGKRVHSHPESSLHPRFRLPGIDVSPNLCLLPRRGHKFSLLSSRGSSSPPDCILLPRIRTHKSAATRSPGSAPVVPDQAVDRQR
ncbi:hypothetical protein M413DRAFT_351552 [Hebeloma cylindrosporum]|uniref:Uncharacterized protein n=1 Tax=Hebeloma cylindrosporum TaxID=76867 RepID=A0A0C2XBC1_HEBCY|nr:hypothetical protein M413DRAFT_351552 [Hebeloma cylindrosporum h7]